MAILCLPPASRSWSSYGEVATRSYGVLSRPSSLSWNRRSLCLLAFVTRTTRPYTRLFACSADPSSPVEEPKASPERMPLVPEPRPKPTTAVAVVEQYIEKLWRDFFTNPSHWTDNRLKKRAPKYADFKHKITKEGLWMNARWNPPWVRVELSLMKNFRPVPLDAVLDGEDTRKEPMGVDTPAKPFNSATSGPRQSYMDVWRRSDNGSGSTYTDKLV